MRLFAHALEKLAPLGAREGGVDLATVRSGTQRASALAVAWHEGSGEAPTREDAPELRPA